MTHSLLKLAILVAPAVFPLAIVAQDTHAGFVASNSSAEKSAGKVASAEERMVREAYEKLMRYSLATALYEFNGKAEDLPPEASLQFDLSNFHTGPIEELKELSVEQTFPRANGQVIYIKRRTHSANDKVEAAYTSRWSQEENTSTREMALKVVDLFNLEPADFFDVGKYTTYDVTVSFEGQRRSYKAIVLFHNLHSAAHNPRLEFFDPVGAGGILTEAVIDKAPPISGKNPLLRPQRPY